MQGAAAWVTLKVSPAMVREPVRCAGVLFWVTVNPTVPFPVPDWPNEGVIQLVLLRDVQAHVEALAPTVITESLLLLLKLALDGVRVNVHWDNPGRAANATSAARRINRL